MAGWVLDILVEYLVRVVMRIVQLLRSRSWPTVIAQVTSSFYVKAGFGCDIVEIDYKYRVNGQSYTGMHKKPWFGAWGDEYAARFPRGTELVVLVKPGEPSVSVMERPGSVEAEPAKVESD
jgi:uncharacterized protein DUF3592